VLRAQAAALQASQSAAQGYRKTPARHSQGTNGSGQGTGCCETSNNEGAGEGGTSSNATAVPPPPLSTPMNGETLRERYMGAQLQRAHVTTMPKQANNHACLDTHNMKTQLQYSIKGCWLLLLLPLLGQLRGTVSSVFFRVHLEVWSDA
jgi:hypothetical protein